MPVYKYKGYDASGAKVAGEVTAGNLEEVERRLSSQEVTVISVIPASYRGRSGEDAPESTVVVRSRGRVSDADAAGVLRSLSIMAETGVPFIEALDSVIASARTPAIAHAVQVVREEVIGGKSLSNAMKAAPAMFPVLVTEMVRVAEEGGRLDHALASASTYLERAADLRRRIMNAMLYPLVMMGISFITVAILIIFVMPKFGTIFSKMKADVPATTRMLLAGGDYIRANPMASVGILIALGIGVRLLFNLPAVQRGFVELMLRMPVLGELLKNLALSRAFQSISTLLKSNVSLMAALEHGAKVSGNHVVNDALMRARVSVEHGGSLYDALRETKIFPKMLLQMVSVGERTGRLATLLGVGAASMEEEVDSRLKALVSIVEPLMIVVMGVIVGTITISVISPIYSVVQNIK